MKRVFRVARRNLPNPWSVQWRPPLWASFFVPVWTYEGLSYATREEAEQNMLYQMAVEGYDVQVPPQKPTSFESHTHRFQNEVFSVMRVRGNGCRLCRMEGEARTHLVGYEDVLGRYSYNPGGKE